MALEVELEKKETGIHKRRWTKSSCRSRSRGN
jgi:hypothetical protein